MYTTHLCGVLACSVPCRSGLNNNPNKDKECFYCHKKGHVKKGMQEVVAQGKGKRRRRGKKKKKEKKRMKENVLSKYEKGDKTGKKQNNTTSCFQSDRFISVVHIKCELI